MGNKYWGREGTMTSTGSDRWQQGRWQNTYQRQTLQLLSDSRLGPWASAGILSVHFYPTENWQARTQQLSTPFSPWLFSAQWTHEGKREVGRVISPDSLILSVFSLRLPLFFLKRCPDNSPRKCLNLSNFLKQKSDAVLQRHHLVLSVYFSVANFYSFPNVYSYFSVLYFINSRD